MPKEILILSEACVSSSDVDHLEETYKYELRDQPQEFNPTSVQSDAKKTEALTSMNKLSKQSHFADEENRTQTF